MPRRASSIVCGAIVERDKCRLARQMRRTPTPSEKLAWSLLRDRRCLGLKWRRQQVIGPYIVDFYCVELRLALEIDGGVHLDPDIALYDRTRDEHLGARGVRVVRIHADAISGELLRTTLASFVPVRT